MSNKVVSEDVAKYIYSDLNEKINNIDEISMPDASSTTKGGMKLYTSTGTNTDGTMTQNSIRTEINNAINYSYNTLSIYSNGIVGVECYNVLTPPSKDEVIKETNNLAAACYSGLISTINTDSEIYWATKTYSVGDYCIHNNTLWKCLIQCSGQTPTEGSYWTKTSVGSELKALWAIVSSLS